MNAPSARKPFRAERRPGEDLPRTYPESGVHARQVRKPSTNSAANLQPWILPGHFLTKRNIFPEDSCSLVQPLHLLEVLAKRAARSSGCTREACFGAKEIGAAADVLQVLHGIRLDSRQSRETQSSGSPSDLIGRLPNFSFNSSVSRLYLSREAVERFRASQSFTNDSQAV